MMAKVTGPLFSMTASGAVGKSLIYRKHAKKTIAGFYKKPSYSRTEAQDVVRSKFGTLSSIYSQMFARHDRIHNDYLYLARYLRLGISARNMFIQLYMPEDLKKCRYIVSTTAIYGEGRITFSACVFKGDYSLPLQYKFCIGRYPYNAVDIPPVEMEETAYFFVASADLPVSADDVLLSQYTWGYVIDAGEPDAVSHSGLHEIESD